MICHGTLQKKKSPVCSMLTMRVWAQAAGAKAVIVAFVDEKGLDIVGKTDYAGVLLSLSSLYFASV